MAQAYPLAWPAGVPRTKPQARQRARFSSSRTEYVTHGDGSRHERRLMNEKGHRDALNALTAELDMLGARSIVVSTNSELKANGEPYANQKLEDVGIAVYFHLKGKPYCLPCDKWDRMPDNLYAVAKHINAMRGQTRWGVASVEQAFAGFKLLPESIAARRSCFEVLGVQPGATADEIKAAHREAVRMLHPDQGGDGAIVAEVNAARDEALKGA